MSRKRRRYSTEFKFQVSLAAGERANLVARLEQIELIQVAYADFTEVRFADGRRKAYQMPIIGHVCKMAYGWAVGERPNTALALRAWQRAKATSQRYDILYVGMITHHNQDPIFTGYGWTSQLLLKDGVRLSYALQGARDNHEMEPSAVASKPKGTRYSWTPRIWRNCVIW